MQPAEIITVADARSALPLLLSRLQAGGRDAEPIFISAEGADGTASGVLISVELFEELSAVRTATSPATAPEVQPPPSA